MIEQGLSDNRATDAEFVRWVYQVLLRREPEAWRQYTLSHGPDARDRFIMRVLKSPEFAFGDLAKLLYAENWTPDHGLRAAALAALCQHFPRYSGPPAPGYYIDFLGVKTNTAYIPGMHVNDGQIFGYPMDEQAMLFGLGEWEATLRSVIEAKKQLVAIELGAGWGPWLVTSAAAARAQGITKISLAGVEASAEHYELMRRHLADNGLDPADHFLFNGVVGTYDGVAQFPKLPNAALDWGAQAVFADQRDAANVVSGKHQDYRGLVFEEVDSVPCIALSTLLSRYKRVDIVHCDIQGSEADVVDSAIDALSRTTRRFAVGTHSRSAEGRLIETFLRAGWLMEVETTCRFLVDKGRAIPLEDGVQVWSNPRLA